MGRDQVVRRRRGVRVRRADAHRAGAAGRRQGGALMAAPLEGKVAAITGASSGIGAATALALSRAGAAVALGARREDRLRELAEKIDAEGGRARPFALDVADEASARGFVEAP